MLLKQMALKSIVAVLLIKFLAIISVLDKNYFFLYPQRKDANRESPCINEFFNNFSIFNRDPGDKRNSQEEKIISDP